MLVELDEEHTSAAYASQSSPARDNNNNNPEIRKLYYGAQLNVQEENNGRIFRDKYNMVTINQIDC